MKIPIFPGKYHQNGGFSISMLVYGSVILVVTVTRWRSKIQGIHGAGVIMINAVLQGKSLKITIDLHQVWSPKMGPI